MRPTGDGHTDKIQLNSSTALGSLPQRHLVFAFYLLSLPTRTSWTLNKPAASLVLSPPTLPVTKGLHSCFLYRLHGFVTPPRFPCQTKTLDGSFNPKLISLPRTSLNATSSAQGYKHQVYVAFSGLPFFLKQRCCSS